jgi:hypothetical protein
MQDRFLGGSVSRSRGCVLTLNPQASGILTLSTDDLGTSRQPISRRPNCLDAFNGQMWESAISRREQEPSV